VCLDAWPVMLTTSNAAAGVPGIVVSHAQGTNTASLCPAKLPCGVPNYAITSLVAGRAVGTGVCTSPSRSCSARSTSTGAGRSGCISARSQPDLVKIRRQSFKAIRVESCSWTPRRDESCNVIQSACTDQAGKACDEYAPENRCLDENHGVINEFSIEKMRCSFDSKLYAAEQRMLEHVKLQCHGWQTGFDNRLSTLEEHAQKDAGGWQTDFDNRLSALEEHAQKDASGWQMDFDSRLSTLEEHTQKDASKMVRVEDRFSAIENCMAPLLDVCVLKHQQSLDLHDDVAKIKTIVSDLEESLGRNSKETVHQHNVDQKRHSNKLTSIPEDGSPAIHEPGGILLGPEHQQELANSQGSFAHRLCFVECKIDTLVSIIKNMEDRLSSMKRQLHASSRAVSTRRRSNQKSTGSNAITFSREPVGSYGATYQPDAAPLV